MHAPEVSVLAVTAVFPPVSTAPEAGVNFDSASIPSLLSFRPATQKKYDFSLTLMSEQYLNG